MANIYQLNYLKESILDVVKLCNIVMAINISKSISKMFKSQQSVECCLCFSILDAVECCFYFSVLAVVECYIIVMAKSISESISKMF